MTLLQVVDVFQGLYDHRFTRQIYGAAAFMTAILKGREREEETGQLNVNNRARGVKCNQTIFCLRKRTYSQLIRSSHSVKMWARKGEGTNTDLMRCFNSSDKTTVN